MKRSHHKYKDGPIFRANVSHRVLTSRKKKAKKHPLLDRGPGLGQSTISPMVGREGRRPNHPDSPRLQNPFPEMKYKNR